MEPSSDSTALGGLAPRPLLATRAAGYLIARAAGRGVVLGGGLTGPPSDDLSQALGPGEAAGGPAAVVGQLASGDGEHPAQGRLVVLGDGVDLALGGGEHVLVEVCGVLARGGPTSEVREDPWAVGVG